jgi:hypothetical protein
VALNPVARCGKFHPLQNLFLSNYGANRIDRSAEAVRPEAGQVRQMRCWESSEEMVTGS